jgi:hypothetical protein
LDFKRRPDRREVLAKVAVALNLQLQAEAQSPFLQPKGLCRTGRQGRRLALYGTSGCGKTRCAMELVGKARPMHLYVVNPKSPVGASVKRASLANILAECRDNNGTIIWDDFPEGLERKSPHITNLAIRMIARHPGPGVILALDPEYVEREGVNGIERLGIRTVQILYSLQDMKKMLSRSAAKLVSRKMNSIIASRLDEFALAIWQAEPTPKAVLDCLGALAAGEPEEMEPDSPVRIVEKFSIRLEDYGRRFRWEKLSCC